MKHIFHHILCIYGWNVMILLPLYPLNFYIWNIHTLLNIEHTGHTEHFGWCPLLIGSITAGMEGWVTPEELRELDTMSCLSVDVPVPCNAGATGLLVCKAGCSSSGNIVYKICGLLEVLYSCTFLSLLLVASLPVDVFDSNRVECCSSTTSFLLLVDAVITRVEFGCSTTSSPFFYVSIWRLVGHLKLSCWFPS